MHKKHGIIIAVIALLAMAYFYFDLGSLLSLDTLRAQHQALTSYYQQHQVLTIGIYFIAYVLVTALSLPGAAIMTLAGGALFGLLAGTVIVSFASTLGASLAFLTSRYLLKDAVQRRFKQQLQPINEGIAKDGAFYLFTLRLLPVFPFFLVNLTLGLTPIKLLTYALVSQLGMLAGTIVFVNAGTQLSSITSTGDILSPMLLGSFAALGLLPIIAKKAIDMLQKRRVYKDFNQPKQFDRNLIVIGAGSGGLVSAYIAAAVKADVTLIEKHAMGGDCLNTGCVPSKALLRSAKVMHQSQSAQKYGLRSAPVSLDFKEVMQRVHQVIADIAPHDSVERYEGLGVEVIQGEGKLIDPWTVEVNNQKLTARSIIVASGARPFVPPIPGLADIDYLTSDSIWQLEALPKRLVVLGGGPIGTELTQAFARLGSQVTQVEMLSRIMIREDAEVSELVANRLVADGVNVLTDTKAERVEVIDGQKTLVCTRQGETLNVEFDHILVAVGRRANTQGFGLEELGVTLNPNQTIQVDSFLRTNFPNIFAVGDVAGPYQFTHTAAHMAWFASVNALFGDLKKFRVDYKVIPWATFSDPEVARVGLNEEDAKAQDIPYEVTCYPLDDLDRAIADSETTGFVKVLTQPNKDKILGVTIVGNHAGDLIAEYVLAMKHGLGLNKILGTIHIYPTMAEANKYAAGIWKRAHAPNKLLEWVKRFHQWRLS